MPSSAPERTRASVTVAPRASSPESVPERAAFVSQRCQSTTTMVAVIWRWGRQK